MNLTKLAAFISTVFFTVSPGSARAAIVTTGDFQDGTPTPTVTMTQDFHLSITTTGDLLALAFDEWVMSDGTLTQLSSFPSGQTFAYQLDGGSVMTTPLGGLVDNIASSIGSTTPNDGLLILNGAIPVLAGQILTVKAQSFTYFNSASFNPSVPPTFTGSVFGTNADLNRLSANTAVPEPSTWALLALGGGAFLAMRKRRIP